MSEVTAREVWTEARRRLVARYLREHPGTSMTTAMNIVSERHEEIGAIMDAIGVPSGKRK